MRNNGNFVLLLSGLLAVGGSLALSGCMNNDYDLDNLDKKIGIGGSGLQLPTNNSVKDITLDDFMDLDESSSVSTDANGDYIYHENGSDIEDVSVNIEEIKVSKSDPTSYHITIPNMPASIEALSVGQTAVYTGPSINEHAGTFSNISDAQDYVSELKYATVDGGIEVQLNFSQKVKRYIKNFSKIEVQLPTYLDVAFKNPATDNPNGGVLDPAQPGKITFTNLSPMNDIYLKLDIAGVDFSAARQTAQYGAITLAPTAKAGESRVSMKGDVYIDVTVGTLEVQDVNVTDGKGYEINTIVTTEDLIVSEVKGKFTPTIDVDDSKIDLDDLPDFMTKDEVKLDLYNPQIIFNATTSLPLPGTIKATIIPMEKDGSESKDEQGHSRKIVVDGIKILAGNNQQNKICIAKLNENIPEGCTDVKTADLNKIFLPKMPYRIDVKIDAKADEDNVHTVTLGTYDMKDINYDVTVPLAFGDKAQIVYDDSFDGWEEDMPDDMDLSKFKLEFGAKAINGIPASMIVEAEAIRKDGSVVEDVQVVITPQDVANPKAGVLAGASKDAAGNLVEGVTDLKIEINPLPDAKGLYTNAKLKEIDGLRYKLVAKPTPGITLNKENHKIQLKDISIKLVGGVVLDLN